MAELTFTHDTDPGFSRRRAGRGFCYYDTAGRRICDVDVVDRVRKIAIPPAWKSVWICPDPRGHIQAVGRDARGRKQYRYHSRYRQMRDRVKFDSLTAFCAVLPRIRRRVERDLARRGLPRAEVLATVVRLLATTYI